jgi:hypothetical protein
VGESVFAVSVFAVSGFAVSVFAVSGFAVSGFAVSVGGPCPADMGRCTSPFPISFAPRGPEFPLPRRFVCSVISLACESGVEMSQLRAGRRRATPPFLSADSAGSIEFNDQRDFSFRPYDRVRLKRSGGSGAT